MPKEISVSVAGRALKIEGSVEQYLCGYQNWDAEFGAHIKIADQIAHEAVCIDAGANIGIVACTLAAKRPDLKIIAIEPVTDNFNNLCRNVQSNGLTNVEVVQAAVAAKPGTLKMVENGPWSTVIDTAGYEVAAISLDQFKDQQVGFLKIDVEGYEPHVLAGARELLDRRKPLVFMEFNAWCLMLHGFDPIAFSKAVFDHFYILQTFSDEAAVQSAMNELSVIHDNITSHKSVTDIFMRPKKRLPDLQQMICSSEVIAMRTELQDLRQRFQQAA